MLNIKFFKNVSTYLGSSIINKAIPFLLLPLLTRYLSPTEYGVLALFQTYVSFSTPFISMNMQNNINRKFYKTSQEEMAKIISNMLIVLVVCLSIVLLLITCYLDKFYLISSDGLSAKWFYLIPILVAFNTINEFNLTLFRNKNQALLYAAFEITSTVFHVGITMFFIMVFHWGWQGSAGGTVIVGIIYGLVSLVWLYRSGFLKIDFNIQRIREILIISIPLIFHGLGTVVINWGDRLLINQMLGKQMLGIYAVGYQFGMIIMLFTDAFNKAWSPWMYKQLSSADPDKKIMIVKFTYFYDFGIILLALGLALVSNPLLKIMTTEAYYGASKVIVWIALGYAIRGMYTMVFPYLVFVGKTAFLGIMTTVSAGINMLGNIFLIKPFGIVGSGIATMISFIILFLGVWWYSNKIFPMPWGFFTHKKLRILIDPGIDQ